MADLVSYGNADRDTEQALIALKKGAQLLKYGRQGKPKFCPFRLSIDETSLIWISGDKEKSLKLASVSRIIPGQRTAVFRRYLRPEKEYLSFSLIYKNGKRSLDLICKDKVQAEIWIAGLKFLISPGQADRPKIDGWGDGPLYIDDKRDLTSTSPSSSPASTAQEISSSDFSLSSKAITSPAASNAAASPDSSHVALNRISMQVKGSNSDAFRVSVSSAPSTSSHGSAPDDCDTLGDVYIWGEVICDNIINVGPVKNASSTRTDILLPKPLESNIVMDVHHVACGVRHAALVTRQGEVFTWGEESGGRLGHGVGNDVPQPLFVESLGFCSAVACGEFHTCAVTMDGELYTWGDGTHHAGLLGHGTNVSHCIPKRISGPLDGILVAMVSCGPWHTALITSTGQLFTFGDGTFGVLGHGNRENVMYPKEVESLSGLRTAAISCGVWHTAAVVEVIVTHSSSSIPSGKLFTWGDGDKNRLGHGDKEPRLKPTCVPTLIDYDFHKIACGHSLTVGLTTSGRVFTMGSTVYGQLGNPRSDGKLPSLVEDKLGTESVEEVSCGAYHVAVLTSKNEVYTWGKGANGRLGHGDVEDRKVPTLVEALKDRHVKFIACGSTYTSAICLHRWVSGSEQSQCSGCRQSFGFTRKRHNCYNCGLLHCHSCSSKKARMAAMSPNPKKPYRVCDSCFVKLSKVAEGGSNNNRRNSGPRLSGENKDRLDKVDLRMAKSAIPLNFDMMKQLDMKAAKQGKKGEAFPFGRISQASLTQLGEAVLFTGVDARRNAPKQIMTTPSNGGSRPVSPFSRKSSPPRSKTPVPTRSGLSFSKSPADSLKKANELLNREVNRLRAQVENLKGQCERRELELEKVGKQAQEAMALAAEESAKCKAAKEVIKSLTTQVKDMAERLPPGAYNPETLKLIYLPNGSEPNGVQHPGFEPGRISDASTTSSMISQAATAMGVPNITQETRLSNSSEINEPPDARPSSGGGGRNSSENNQADLKSKSLLGGANATEIEAEWVDQYEPGVYITLVALRDGTRDLKRVRFSRRFFGEHQAETWWSENREKLYQKYNIQKYSGRGCGSDKS